ncbi:MAG: hypothetical protein WBA37_11970 [Xanthobacteraceae bacterium]
MSTAPTLDDIQSDIWHLYHLLEAIVDEQLNLPHDKTGDSPQDRVDSLTWIARDVARKLATDTDSVSSAVAKGASIYIIRAERAEQALRNVTQELDRAHREIEQIKQAGQVPA